MSKPAFVFEIYELPNGLLKASVPTDWMSPDAPKWKKDAVAAVKALIDALAKDPVRAAVREIHGLPARPRFTT